MSVAEFMFYVLVLFCLRLDHQAFALLLLKEELLTTSVIRDLSQHYGGALSQNLGRAKSTYDKMSLKGKRSFDQWCASFAVKAWPSFARPLGVHVAVFCPYPFQLLQKSVSLQEEAGDAKNASNTPERSAKKPKIEPSPSSNRRAK